MANVESKKNDISRKLTSLTLLRWHYRPLFAINFIYS